jgi:predicted HNH restriction endonuclease
MREMNTSPPDRPTISSEDRQELLNDIEAERKEHNERKRLEKARRVRTPEGRAKENARHREYMKEKAHILYPKQKERYREQKQRAIDFKGGACADCGGRFHPAAFDFHHVNGDGNELSTRRGWTALRWERVEAELLKCELLCSNCHRIRHFNTE